MWPGSKQHAKEPKSRRNPLVVPLPEDNLYYNLIFFILAEKRFYKASRIITPKIPPNPADYSVANDSKKEK